MQWLEDPKQNNVYSLNNVRCEAGRHFRKKDGIYECETNSKIKNIRALYRDIKVQGG
jgi:hypothetical protein